MLISSWLKSFRSCLARPSRRVRNTRGPVHSRVMKSNEELETRVLLAAPTLVKVASTNTGQLISTNVNAPDTLSVAPEQFTLTFNPGQSIDVASARGAVSVINDTTGQAVDIGFVGAGASPEDVVVRFAGTLGDGSYTLNIADTLQNTAGEFLNDADADGVGASQQVAFNLDLGAQVVAVVPQPVNTSGTLSQARDQVVVYFNDDDLDPAAANSPEFYQLINAEPNPADPNDLVRIPTQAVYDATANTTTLTFAADIDTLFGPGETHFRLRIGNDKAPPDTRTSIDSTTAVVTTFGYLRDEDSDGVDEFVEVKFQLAAPAIGTSEEGKSVQINFTSNPSATSSIPVITANASTGQIDIQLSSAPTLTSTLVELVSAIAANPTAARLISVEVTPNSNMLAGIGSTLGLGGESHTLFDAGSSFRTAADTAGRAGDLGVLGVTGVTISGAIDPQYFPLDFPGASDEPGQRQIEIFRFTPSFDTSFHPAFVDEAVLTEAGFDQYPYDFIDPALINSDGIETLFYNFQNFVGYTPEGQERTNTITENQKDRVREVFDFYSYNLGVQFVETANRGFTIARSDMRILNPVLFNGAGDLQVGIADPARQLAILDSSENWNDTFGDYTDDQNVGTVNFFEESMELVGLLLGLGNTDHQPALTVLGEDNLFYTTSNSNQVELDYPGDSAVVAGKVVHPPESKDIDLYRFELATSGTLTAEVLAERLTGADTSLLDSALRLYKVTESGGNVVGSELISQNNDYFSEDSFIEINLEAGVYYIGISASGNESYDPTIEDTGLNGTSEGQYKLNIDFSSDVSAGNSLVDTTGTIFDGDHDGVAGGVSNFWFQAVPAADTIFVNRSESIPSGNFNTLAGGERVYNEIDLALAAATSGTIVRIVGNDADVAYEVGRDGVNLRDGSTLDVPKGVTVMIDAGAIIKLKSASIGVGSSDLVTDRSGGALQVLGTPQDKVIFTSWFNENIGGDTTPTPTTAANGDWGGIVFREDVDRDAPGRDVLSDEGVFLNYVAYGEFTYGGGGLVVGGNFQTINPIHTIQARPTVLNNTIVLSNDSAISADPDSFAETQFQDYTRIGPEIFGNILSETTDNLRAVNTTDGNGNPVAVQNASNGLFIRVLTPAGNSQNTLNVSARFDDTDIVHILTENLEIQGTPGGHIDAVAAPELDSGAPNRTTLTSTGVGDLPDGNYSYRMTFVQLDAGGNVLAESPPSDPSDSLFITGDPTTGSAIRLTNLPTATGIFNSRRLYRSSDAVIFTLVAELNASTTSFVDDQLASGRPLNTRDYTQSVARFDASLVVDPGIIIKAEDAAIQVGIGAELIAEGQAGREVIFTSRKDDSFGAGGTFDTNDDASVASARQASAGDWGGIFVGPLSYASISDALVTFGGGSVTVAGGFATFNAIEIHQADARIVNTILENNADGTGGPSPDHRYGRGSNGAAVIFVRGSQPVVASNTIRNNDAPALSINANALNSEFVADKGRSRGETARVDGFLDNQGPLITNNVFDANSNNGMFVRGEVLTTQGVWDDTNIVHVLQDQEIVIPDVYTYGGLRLESSSTQSLVVKLQGPDAGFTAIGRPLDISDSIGGTLHIIGQPGKPVVLTSLADDTVGAGFDADGLPQNDTNGDGNASQPQPGDWRAITIDQFANDRNVGIHVEAESRVSSAPGVNAISDTAEFLGELAPLEFVSNAGDLAPLTGPSNALRGGGDDTLRLGFEVHGVLNQRNDIDVYSFTGTAGSEVWIDIDRTTHALDTVVELVDGAGRILASSDNTLDEQSLLYELYEDAAAVAAGLKANSLNKSVHESDDFFSTNQRDAGLRVVLPGSLGARGTFYIRVRSSSVDSLNDADSRSDLLDASKISDGKTAGAYQLQLRLREEQEVPGSTVRYADIRYAINGIEVLGQPTSSPLLGEFAEDPNGDVSNNFGQAAGLGNLLNTDQGTISVSGNLSREDDIDWYRFDLRYDAVRDDDLSVTDGHVSVVFDMDFADDVGGANTRLSVFDENGSLVLFSEDSNITDDRPAGNEAAGDTDDPSRGSVGNLDPYIGPVSLPVGTYYVAVTSNAQLPSALSQYLVDNATGAQLNTRLEPVNSIRRIAYETFDATYLGSDQPTADESADLFDEFNLTDTNRSSLFGRGTATNDPNRVAFELSDVTLFISHDYGISGNSDRIVTTADPFTGAFETLVGPDVTGQQPVGDIAIRPDGQLMAFSTGPSTGNDSNGASDDYFVIDTGNGTQQNIANASGSHNIQTWFHDGMGADVQQASGLDVAALAYTGLGNNDGIFVAHRGDTGLASRTDPIEENIVFAFDIRNGSAVTGNNGNLIAANGAKVDSPWGLSHTPQGVIDTSVGLGGRVNGIAYDYSTDRYYAVDDSGGLYLFDLFSVVDSSTQLLQTTFIGDIGTANGLGAVDFQGLTFGPADVQVDPITLEGRYENTLFAISSAGELFAFDVNGRPDPIFVDGQTHIPTDAGAFGARPTGLAFGTLDQNLWHVESRNIDDDGVGPGTPVDQSRDLTDDAFDQGNSLYFGPDFSTSGSYGNRDDRGTDNSIQDNRNLDFPGGAHGTIISNEFDLSPYTSADKPFFSFNYYLQTENVEADAVANGGNEPMLDSFRVFVGGDDGVWNLVATNNSLQGVIDEFDYAPTDPNNPLDVQSPITLTGQNITTFPLTQNFPDVVELYDASATTTTAGSDAQWRNAYVDLSNYAGRDNLKFRFDFSTAGAMDFADGTFHFNGGSYDENFGDRAEDLLALPANELRDGERFELDGDGNFIDIDAFNAGTTTVTPVGDHFEFDYGYAILTPSGSGIASGNTFTVRGTAFEFDKGFPTTAVNAVGINNLNSAGDIANAVAAAVNAAGLTNSNGDAITVVVAGNRVNFINLETGDLDTSGTPSLTQNAAVEYGEPGVRTGHVPVLVNVGMSRAEVAVAIKTAMAETYFVTPIAGSVATNSGFIDETTAPNDTLATAFNIDLAAWNTNPNASVDNGIGTASTPHISILGTGDGTVDFYSFTADVGETIILDIDNTVSLDSYLTIYNSAGVEIPTSEFVVNGRDDSPLDSGSTSSLDSYIELFLDPVSPFGYLATDTYSVLVSRCCSPVNVVAFGESYQLNVSVTGHPLLLTRPETVEVEPNETSLTPQVLDGGVFATQLNPSVNDFTGADISTTAPYTSVLGSLAAGTSDFYSVTVTDGEQIVLDLDSTGTNGFFILNVFDGAGNHLAGYDTGTNNFFGPISFLLDSGSLNNSDPLIQLNVASSNGVGTTDTFLIEVTGWPLAPATGAYELHVSVPSQPDSIAALAQIPDASTIAGSLAADPLLIPGDHTKGMIKVVGHDVTNNGPLGYTNTLPGDEFGAFGVSVDAGTNVRDAGALRGVNNRIEGVWVDDIIIGVAERGHLVVDAPNDTSFTIDERLYGPTFNADGDVDRDQRDVAGTPNNTDLLKGPYTLEIRRASEFGISEEELPVSNLLFRTFEDTDRLTDALTLYTPTVDQLADGQQFTLTDGIDTVVFEFEDINIANGITGDVAIPIDPVLDAFDVNSDEVIAQTIAAIINGSTVQGLLDISATAVDNRVELFGAINQIVDVDPSAGVIGRIASDVVSTHQFTPLDSFDTFQFENTSTTGENIIAIRINLPDGNYFDLRETFNPVTLSTFFEGSAPGVNSASSIVGETFEFVEGQQSGVVTFDNFEPGEKFLFNVGVSHIIDIDWVSLNDPFGTAVSSGADLTGATITTFFDSDASGTFTTSDRSVTGELLPGEFFSFPNSQYESVLAFDALTAQSFNEFGDSNTPREQGQIIIESNTISDSANYAIVSGPGVSDLSTHRLGDYVPGAGVLPGQGAVRNAVELNDLAIVPGIVIENNILVRSGTGGIDFAGDANGVAPFGRIVNNTIVGGSITTTGGGNTVTFDGIDFPNGLSSFADAVVQYAPIPISNTPLRFADPAAALGTPDEPGAPIPPLGTVVSLGNGGVLVLEFTDNILVPSGDSTPDLHVFEAGSVIEIMQVDVSEDGVNWIDVGTLAGQPLSLDIDAAVGINPAGLYRFVRITDDAADNPANGVFAGVDIDAVGAISSVPVTTTGLGAGINIRDNAAPTVINNALASLNTAILIDATSDAAGTTIGANLYVDNVDDLAGVAAYGTFDASDQQAGNPDWTVNGTFVDVDGNNFYPAAGSPLIDSSLDTLVDRSELVTIRDPLGIAASPILAPNLDAFGQTRGDDDSPGTGPGAPGANVRKDRGAIDRVDFDNPEATVLFVDSRLTGQVEVLDEQEERSSAGDVILSESDTAIGEIGRLAAGAASAVRQFVLRFDDIGVGIDDAPILAALNDTTGTIPLPFSLAQDGVPLTEGVDYVFVWNSNTDEAIFTHVTEFPLEANYTIVVDNDPTIGVRADLPAGTADPNPADGVTGVRDLAGNFLAINQPDGTTQYQILLTDGVNDAPINAIPIDRQRTNEDVALTFLQSAGNGVSVSDDDVHLAVDPALNVSLVATNGTLSLSQITGLTLAAGNSGTNENFISFRGSVADINAALEGLTFTPDQDYFNMLTSETTSLNPATITITTDDGDLSSPPQGQFSGVDTAVKTTVSQILIDVVAVNDLPSFSRPVINPPAIDEDATPVTIAGFVTGMVAGPSPSEDGQAFAFVVQPPSITGNLQFVVGQEPAIDVNGTLTYAVVGDTNGSATFSFTLVDENASDPLHAAASSLPAVVQIVVNPVNDEPVFTTNTLTVNTVEDGGVEGPFDLVDTFAAGPATATDEIAASPAGQTLTFMNSVPVATTGNLAFASLALSPTGDLTFEAVPNTSGTATFSMWLEDSGPTSHALDENTSDAVTVTINVEAQPDPPTAVTPNYIIDAGDSLLLDASGSSDPDLAYAGPAVTEQLLYSWDLNNDGTFDLVDQASSQLTLPYADLNQFALTVPGDNPITLRVTDTYSGTSVDAAATLTVQTVDYGDANDSYGTLKASNGAAHTIVPGFFLGASVDSEFDGQADDGADEDGIVFEAGMQADDVLNLSSFFTATASAPGKLDLWVDFDNSGTFEPEEHLNAGTSYDLVAGANLFDFAIAAGRATAGVDTGVRARFSSTGGLSPTGRASDGEVEDQVVQFSELLDAVAVQSVLPAHPQTSDSTPIIQWTPVSGSAPGANATYNVELRDALNQVVGFQEGHVGESITISDSLAPGVYTAFITSINRAGVALQPASQLTSFEVVAIAVTFPLGAIQDNTPTITWTPVDKTDHYELQILSGLTGNLLVEELNLTDASFTLSSALDLGTYQVRVRAVEDTTGQVGDWNAFQSFQVGLSPNITAPVPVAGENAAVVTVSTPEITWDAVQGAATYEVVINDVTDDIAPVQTLAGLTGTSVTLTQPLDLGEYTIQVRAITADSLAGEYSVPLPLMVLPPTDPQVSSQRDDSTPTFTWAVVPGAEQYDLEIIRTVGNVEESVYFAGGLANTVHTLPPAAALPIGQYEIRVTAKNLPAGSSSGQTVTSVNVTTLFTVATPPVILLPDASIYDTTPEITWESPAGTAVSNVTVRDAATNEIVFERSGITGNSIVTDTLPPGTYRAVVTASTAGDPILISVASTIRLFRIGSAPVPLGPSQGLGTAPFFEVVDTRPTLTWQQSLAGEEFSVWLTDVTNQQIIKIADGLQEASYTVEQDLPVGRYRYWARADNGLGDQSAWSVPFVFDVKARPVLEAVQPTFDSRPTFTWNTEATGNLQPEIDQYRVFIRRVDVSPVVDIDTGFTVVGNQYTPTQDLSNGRYRIWVKGINETSVSRGTVETVWSVGQDFEVSGRPIVDSPGTTDDSTPVISWSPVGDASSYQLYVAPANAVGTPVINISGLTTTSFQVSDALPSGSFVAWVRATSSTGELSPWSLTTQGQFTINGSSTGGIGRVVVSEIPTSSDRTPTFTWTADSSADHYDIYVAIPSATNVALIRDTNVSGTTFTSAGPLAPAEYRVWVRAIGADGTIGPWSASVDFTIVAAGGVRGTDRAGVVMLASMQVDQVSVGLMQSVVSSDLSSTIVNESATEDVPQQSVAGHSRIAKDDVKRVAAVPTDDVMAEWDASIWAEESAGRGAVAVEVPEPSVATEAEAPKGWLAGLAMVSTSLFRRRQEKNDE